MNSHLKQTLVLPEILSSIDWLVFFLILAITLYGVFYSHKIKIKNKDDSWLDFFLMGRKLTLPLFVATLVSSWYGGIFGVTEIAFQHGIFNFITQGVFWYVSYIVFALFLVDRVRNYQAITLPEMVSKIYGPRSGQLSAVFNFFNVVPISYSISIGLFLKALFGGDLTLWIAVGTLFSCFYASFGGFRADVFSDVIQFFVMCISVFLVIVFSVSLFGGISFLQNSLNASYFEPTGGHDYLTLIAWGLIAFATLIDPNFYQRAFAAQDSKTAKGGIYISCLIWIGFDLCTTFGAMYAKAVIPEAHSGTAYLTYAIQILPEGLRGFFLAGILATILSTMDSYLIIAGTTLGYDLFPKKFSQNGFPKWIGLLTVGLLSIALSIVFEGNIKAVWKTLGSYFAACLLFPVLFGIFFKKKIKDHEFVITTIVGMIMTTYWRWTSHQGVWQNVDEIYIGLLATSISYFYFYFKVPNALHHR